jgi:hypothetical protein
LCCEKAVTPIRPGQVCLCHLETGRTIDFPTDSSAPRIDVPQMGKTMKSLCVRTVSSSGAFPRSQFRRMGTEENSQADNFIRAPAVLVTEMVNA